MTTDQMRKVLKENTKYEGSNWTRKVDGMSDKQVIALYYKFLGTGMIIKKKKPSYHQITIDEYLGAAK